MNIVTGMISTYIGYSVVKYAVDCFAAAFFNKSTELVSSTAKTTIDYVRGVKKVEKDMDIFYEVIDPDNDDEITLVNSKKRKDSLNENWDELLNNEEMIEIRKDLQNKEIAKKYSTPRMGPLAPPNTPIIGPIKVPNYDALLIL
jgi:hypothetical protein